MFLTECIGVFDLVVVMDSSGSINEEELAKAKNFLKIVVDLLDISSTGIHLGFVNYASSAVLEFCLMDKFSKTDIKDCIDDAMQIGNGTRTDKALTLATNCSLTEGRMNIPQVIMTLTDGASDSR